MIHTKRVIFMILPLLFVPLVYGLSSTPDACAVPRDPNFGKSGSCALSDPEDNPSGTTVMTCCWEEPDILNPGETIQWCQTCDMSGDCTPPYRSSSTGPLVLPDEGVVDETPTPTPTSPFRPPTGGVLDPPTQTPPPPPTQTPVPTPPPPKGDGSGPLNPQGGEILQQPEEVEDPEDEGENEEEEGSSDGDQGQETAGPLT
jgi:hypothetical protein